MLNANELYSKLKNFSAYTPVDNTDLEKNKSLLFENTVKYGTTIDESFSFLTDEIRKKCVLSGGFLPYAYYYNKFKDNAHNSQQIINAFDDGDFDFYFKEPPTRDEMRKQYKHILNFGYKYMPKRTAEYKEVIGKHALSFGYKNQIYRNVQFIPFREDLMTTIEKFDIVNCQMFLNMDTDVLCYTDRHRTLTENGTLELSSRAIEEYSKMGMKVITTHTYTSSGYALTIDENYNRNSIKSAFIYTRLSKYCKRYNTINYILENLNT